MVDIRGPIPHADKFPATVVVELLTERAFAGRLYGASHEFNNVAGGDSVDVMIQSPANDEMHIVTYGYTPDVSSESVQLFEGTDFSDAGSPPQNVTAFNRIDGTAPSSTLTVGPTLNSTGSEIAIEGVPDGTGAGGATAAIDINGVHWVVNNSENYLLRFTNETNNSADTVYFTMLWYEIAGEELKS